MTVLVHERCECGTEVARRISEWCIEVVWCPNCKREFNGSTDTTESPYQAVENDD